MDVTEVLARMGGVATTTALERAASRDLVRRGLASGEVIRLSRGRLALPTADQAVRRAHAVTGVVSHLSAAAWWGWALKEQPKSPEVTVPKDRRVAGDRRGIHFVDLSHAEVHDGIVTTPARTLVDCLRQEPFDAGLAVADSALRHSGRHQADLATIAHDVRGPGAPRVRRIAGVASARAANPFESVLRALALEAGLAVEPQARVRHGREWVVPDLVDVVRRVVLEAESFGWHGDRAALHRDCRRYNWLVRHDWRVLRLPWEDVMHDQPYVTDLLGAIAAEQRTKVRASAGPTP